MSETKTKRKRRSYSCGPCKLLKIKCDLQVPVCSLCVKFKRHDKCLVDPAHPPSREELTKIQERKKRTIIKKLRQLLGALALAPGALPSFDPNVVGDKGDVFRRLAPQVAPLHLLARAPPLLLPPPLHHGLRPPPPAPLAPSAAASATTTTTTTDAATAPPSLTAPAPPAPPLLPLTTTTT